MRRTDEHGQAPSRVIQGPRDGLMDRRPLISYCPRVSANGGLLGGSSRTIGLQTDPQQDI